MHIMTHLTHGTAERIATRAASIPNADTPHFVRGKAEGAFVIVVAAVGLLISMTLVPASVWASSQEPGEQAKQAISAQLKSDRLPKPGIPAACRGEAWGHESHECLAAIYERSGRPFDETIRTVLPR